MIHPESAAPNILVVDDVPENLQLLFRMLKENGYKARPVASGRLALDAARQTPPDLILLDINMPEMNGYDVCAEIKADELLKDIPVIFISALHESMDKVKAFGMGGVDYITKPFQAEEVEARVKTHLELYRQKQVERDLLDKTLHGSVKLLTEILAATDPISFGRARKMRDAMAPLAAALALGSAWEYELAAMLSSIGAVTIPPTVMRRVHQGQLLNEVEGPLVARIPEIGHELLSNIPRLESVAAMVLYQNKDFDGAGFPKDSISGKEIPFGGRLLRILTDLVDFQERLGSQAAAFSKMQRLAGRYDHELFSAITACLEAKGSPTAAPVLTEHKEVAVGQLKPGDIIHFDVMATSGAMIVPAGTVISPMLLRKLQNFAEVGGIAEPVKIKWSPLHGEPGK